MVVGKPFLIYILHLLEKADSRFDFDTTNTKDRIPKIFFCSSTKVSRENSPIMYIKQVNLLVFCIFICLVFKSKWILFIVKKGAHFEFPFDKPDPKSASSGPSLRRPDG